MRRLYSGRPPTHGEGRRAEVTHFLVRRRRLSVVHVELGGGGELHDQLGAVRGHRRLGHGGLDRLVVMRGGRRGRRRRGIRTGATRAAVAAVATVARIAAAAVATAAPRTMASGAAAATVATRAATAPTPAPAAPATGARRAVAARAAIAARAAAAAIEPAEARVDRRGLCHEGGQHQSTEHGQSNLPFLSPRGWAPPVHTPSVGRIWVKC